MKHFALLGIAAAFAVGGMAATTAAADSDKGGKPWQTEVCQYHVEAGHFENMGECMKRVKASADRYCSYLEEIGYFERPNARWKNKGQCQQWYRTRK